MCYSFYVRLVSILINVIMTALMKFYNVLYNPYNK